MATKKLVNNLFLTPAPWRSQTQTREEVTADWQTGKDFLIKNGPYCSIRDIESLRKNYNYIYILYTNGTIKV
jgi:hypothetical protein